MRIFKLSAVLLFTATLLVNCSDDSNEEKILGLYEKGMFVLNEGSSNSGTISYISDDLNVLKKDIYGLENGSDELGKYLQNIFFNEELAYVVAGGSNQVVVVNKNTFKTIAKISKDLVAPRYGVVVNGKAYVTNANTYSYANPDTGNTDDYVAVIDLTTNLVEKKINLNTTADKILAYNNKLYITEPYVNSKLTVVDLKDGSVSNTIEIGKGTNSMEIKNGYLYALNSNGLVKVNLGNNEVKITSLGTDFSSAKNLDVEGDKFYFTVGSSVHKGDIGSLTVSANPLFSYTSTSKWGKAYGFKVSGSNIFITDAGDFTSEGKVYVYSTSGNLIKEFATGIAPNGIY